MPSLVGRSQYDHGETNWSATTGTFDDWCRADHRRHAVIDLRLKRHQLSETERRAADLAGPQHFEPEFT